MKITTEDIKIAIDFVTREYPMMYDVKVTKPSNNLARQRTQDYYNGDMPRSYNNIFKFTDQCKSIIVWNIFSTVAADYFFKNNFLPQILTYLNIRYYEDGLNFGYDDYVLNRKQFAVRSGSAKISKPSLAFHPKFGLNYKIELILSNAEFSDYTIIEDSPRYENCINCDAPCEYSCPQKCKMDFELVDWQNCANFIDTKEMFNNPDNICRICQDKCPFSEDLKKQIESINPLYGKRING